jgi:Xaa-Pro aminopeptidase
MGMVKTNKELRLLKKSAAISNSCIKIIESALREKNITERELARRVRRNINMQGATLSFQTLVGTKERSAIIHTNPHVTDRKISGIGYIDFGARYKGYCSDVTVPFIKGKITRREEKIINACLNAYMLAVKSLKVGEPCWKLFYVVDRYLKRNGFKMEHGLGHGLGLKIHEMPVIAMPRKLAGSASIISLSKSEKKLPEKKLKRWIKIKRLTFQPGMIITIEPGVYVKGIGGCRIENDFLLTRRGPKALTNSKLLKIS